MDNYIFSEVFYFQIYDMKDELLFESKTIKANTVEHRDRSNRLIIEDALVNTKMFYDFMCGKYDGKRVKVVAQTVVRTIDGDKAVLDVEIKSAIIVGYMIEGVAGENAYGSKMVIAFGNVDSMGDKNCHINLSVNEEEGYNGGYTFYE